MAGARPGSKSLGDSSSQRMMRDENNVQKLEEQIKRFNPFNREGEELVYISTNEVAGNNIREDLLTATQRGREQLAGLLEKCLLPDATQSIHDPIIKNKSKTLESLNLVEVSTTTGRSRTIKADRDLFRRLLSAASSGRQIDLKALLQHELSPVPLAIATTDYTLRSTEKAALSTCLLTHMPKPNFLKQTKQHV